jgi:hypothetical protein
MADNQIASKKEKKSKSRRESPESDEPITAITAAASTDPLDVKKMKKQKKSKKNEEGESEGVTVEEIVVEENKEEKKKKKRKNIEAEVETPIVEARSEEKPKKKKKKQSNETSEDISYGNYVVHPDVENMSSSAADSYREGLGLTMTPPEAANLYKPITAFNQLGPSLQAYCPEVLTYLEMKKFPQPSPIQVSLSCRTHPPHRRSSHSVGRFSSQVVMPLELQPLALAKH